jgi:hypothetical protein
MPGSITGNPIATSPASNITYTCIGRDANGCVGQTISSINVTPSPTVSVTGATICAGNSTNLIASGATTYSWNTSAITNSISVTPTTTTVYTVTGTTGSCTNVRTATVVVNALPSVTLASSSSTACTSSSGGITLSLTGSPSGGVYSGVGVVGNTFSAQASAGTYTATYSYTNSTTGCANSANSTIIVAVCTGLNEITGSSANYFIYPNPTDGKITINSSRGVSEQVTTEVIDAIGKTVQKHTINFNSSNKTQELNLSELANGVYFIKLIPEKGKPEMIKIIKE